MKHSTRLGRLFCAGLCVLTLAACRSATTRLHSLSALTGAQTTVNYAGPAVRVDAVHLPAEMDRAEIVTQSAGGGLAVQEFDHWAAPLSKMTQQTLTADLVARLPRGKVILAPLDKPDGALGLNVVILRFSADSHGVQFVANWQVSAGKVPAGGDLVTLKSDAASTAEEVVNRFNELLAQLADRIVAQLVSAQAISP
jgi:uncharacterized lipoprotein YmbA